MSSGRLPAGTYHRAQSLGSGSYGSVLSVYNDDGEEFALKLFVDDDDSVDEEEDDDDESSYDKDDYKTMDLSALREISILRLLRHDNAHTNVIQIHDVTTDGFCDEGEEEGGAGTDGYMGVAMPSFPLGNLSDAIDSSSSGGGGLLASKRCKVQIAHGILSAVAYLHHNGIIHRDIKGDNIMLDFVMDGGEGDDKDCNRGRQQRGGKDTSSSSSSSSSGCDYKPVLIDFSLAKIVHPEHMYGRSSSPKAIEKIVGVIDGMEGENTHTPAVGTPTYKAPEVVSNQAYGLPSDLYSVGVVLLELLRGRTLETAKDKGAARIVSDAVENLPDQPFANLIRALLEVDPEKRWSAKRALESDVFRKFGLGGGGDGGGSNGDDVIDVGGWQETFRLVDIGEAIPLEEGEEEEEEEDSAKVKKRRNQKQKNVVDPMLLKRYHKIQKIAHELESNHPLTIQAALAYSLQMNQLDECIDDLKESQTLVDCVILAHKVFERDMWCFRALEKKIMDRGILKNCNWTVEDYQDNEGSIWLLMDYCLFPRKLLDL